MKRGCLLGLVLYGALAAAYYILLTPYFEWPGNAIAAGLGGLVAAIFIGQIIGLLKAYRDAHRLGEVQAHGVRSFKDGETVAVAGTIRPLGAPIEAPLSGTPCVAYDYDVFHWGSRAAGADDTESSEDKDITGVALTPSIIDTPSGGVRLLSFAMLDEFPQSQHNNAAARARTSAYIAATTFKPMGVTKVSSAFRALHDALTDQDGAVRLDWRMNPEEIDLDGATLRERIVPVGQQVTAIGRYSAERRGLLAAGMSQPIQLRPGDPSTARSAVLRKAWAAFGAGFALFVAGHVMLPAAVYFSETRYRRVSPSQQESVLRSAVQNKDADEIRRVIRRGVDPNVRGSNNDTMLHDLRDANIVRVLTHAGANPNLTNDWGYTPLMQAAHMGLTDVVAALIDGGASVNLARADGGTALSDAIEGDQSETVALLQARGATSDLVTAENGRALPADGGEPMQTVRAYLAAVHARDVKGLYAAFIPLKRKGIFEGTDFDLWHKIRPQEPVLISGFTNGTAATLAIGGATISRWPYAWHYQLVYKNEDWRIAREWDTSTNKPSKAPAATLSTPLAQPSPPPSLPAQPVERPRGR